ncbi:MAG: hypothetical protein HY662_03150 [Chloroflexi bacterium]|nr:hypothetical protein [Chloroflexota bacterium]
MNWFERYGIPGAYFVALMVGWSFVFYQEDLRHMQSLATVLTALIAVSFLPIGYVLSVTSQWAYLRWFGLHRQALRQALGGDNFIRFRNESEANAPRDEATVEARTLLLTVLGSISAGNVISMESHQYIRNWIARRMDVQAINQSLILANVLGFILALIVVLFNCKPWAFLALFGFVTLVTLIMFLSILALRRQVVQTIAGLYQVYR